MENNKKLRVNIINYEQTFNNGILSKYANKMKSTLKSFDVDVSVSAMPREDVDINHHINYLPYKPNNTKNTLMITHIFEGYKFDRVRVAMETADKGICFSYETMDYLSNRGLDKSKLCVVLPAHDNLPRKKIKVAVVSNVYPDGCKREAMFYNLITYIKKEQLLYKEFEFHVMGTGWVFDKLDTPLVKYYGGFNDVKYRKILKECDYMLYFGLDEGAMSILDAAHVGLKTIAPAIGFHKEIGVDYSFISQDELNLIFTNLGVNRVDDWTWYNYCAKHFNIWENLK